MRCKNVSLGIYSPSGLVARRLVLVLELLMVPASRGFLLLLASLVLSITSLLYCSLRSILSLKSS